MELRLIFLTNRRFGVTATPTLVPLAGCSTIIGQTI